MQSLRSSVYQTTERSSTLNWKNMKHVAEGSQIWIIKYVLGKLLQIIGTDNTNLITPDLEEMLTIDRIKEEFHMCK